VLRGVHKKDGPARTWEKYKQNPKVKRMKVRRRQTRQSKHIISGKGKYWEAEDLCFSLLSDPLAICQRYGDWQLHVKARENV